MSNSPTIGVIGGSGVYKMPELENVTQHDLETPFGKPSSPIMVGTLHGVEIAFLARHGIGHHISPTEVNYRANIYALKSLGIKEIISVSACGSLREDYAPGDIVIPDQLFDFTKDRKRSFFENGLVAHVGVAEPFCPRLSSVVQTSIKETGLNIHVGGTFITIEGPRFSTRGESNIFRSWGMSIVGMTTSPEAFLAREAEMCYTVMAHITDYDVWHVSEETVSVEMVMRNLRRVTEAIQQALSKFVVTHNHAVDCSCQHALADALITNPEVIPPDTRQRLGLLVNRYLQSADEG
jgi:5'-methylthioadenosine phosphorylase